eukprot:scaffold20339_cov128-Cylindrotheca_fusiformis.AAC.4
MKTFALISILSLLLAIASANSKGPVSFGQFKHRQHVTHPSIARHNTARTLRGGQEETNEGPISPEEAFADVENATIETPKEVPQSSDKLANLIERTLPALVMLGCVGALTYYAKEMGLMGLTFLLQMGMYDEMTNVVGGKLQPVMKWWWFLTSALAFDGPRVLPAEEAALVTTTAYGMTMFGIVSTILRLQLSKANAAAFREFMRQTAISAVSLLLVVLPSSFWLSTLKEFGLIWIVYSVALVIINDTMAYLFGIIFGKHLLLPTISPKKTWEGFFGAAVSTVAVAYYWLPDKQDAVVISSFASLIGPFGGFLASVIKRAFEQKDFGTFIPGHGGFVDRLDCQLVLAPFVYLYLLWKTSK